MPEWLKWILFIVVYGGFFGTLFLIWFGLAFGCFGLRGSDNGRNTDMNRD